MWGIIPAAGAGTRIQPLAFSKELLPVGSRIDNGIERPKAVCEYLIERLVLGGADRICFVISAGKSDIIRYFGARVCGADVCYVVQQKPRGLCDAVFAAMPVVSASDEVLVGLPDTVWFPDDGLARLRPGGLSLLLFPVEHPEYFDAVVTDEYGAVREIQVKQPGATSTWVWGAFRMSAPVMRSLHALWLARGRSDEYIGTLVNAYLSAGGRATGVRAGEAYVDVGTLNGYREAIHALAGQNLANTVR